jgi:hypothetical protein
LVHNYHSALPFQGGYEPPHLPMGSIPNSKVEAVDEGRQEAMVNLKEHLQKSVNKIHKIADQKRTDREESVGYGA